MRRVRTILILVLILAAAGTVAAQTPTERALFERIGVDEATVAQIEEMQLAAERLAREAGVEQKLLQARLEKLLLEADPDMRQVEAILRESLEWKLKVEMQNIHRNVEMRQLLGEERWMRLLRERREIRERIETRREEQSRDTGAGGSSEREPRENRSSRP